MNSSTFPLLLETFPACDLFGKMRQEHPDNVLKSSFGLYLEQQGRGWSVCVRKLKELEKREKQIPQRVHGKEQNAHKPQGKKVKGVPSLRNAGHTLFPLQTKSIFPTENRDFCVSSSAHTRVCSSLGLPLKPWHQGLSQLATPGCPKATSHTVAMLVPNQGFALLHFHANFFILGSSRSILKTKLSFSNCTKLFIRESQIVPAARTF